MQTLGRIGFLLSVLWAVSILAGQGQSMAVLQDKLSRATTDTARVRLLAELAVQTRNEGIDDRGLATIQESIALARQLKFTRNDAFLYLTLGRVYRFRTEYSASIRAYQTAIQLCQKTSNAPLLRKARYALAVVLTDYGDYPAANRQTIENLKQIRLANDPGAEVANLSLLALLYQFQKNTAGQIACANQMIAVGRRIGNAEYMALGYSSRAEAERDRHQYDQALDYRRRGLTLFRRPPVNVDYLLTELINYAQDLRLAGLPNDVWPVLHEARHLAEQQQSLFALASCWTEYGLAYLYRHNGKAARESAQLAVHYARQSRRPRQLLDALDTQVRIYRELGDYKQAFQATGQYDNLKDSIDRIVSSETIMRLQMQLDQQRDQDSLQLLRQRLTVTQLRASQREQAYQLQQQRQLLFWITIGGLSLLVAGAVFTLMQMRKAQRLLQQKNGEIEQKSMLVNQLNAEKDRLFAIIGHDLRAPMASLQHQLYYLRFTQISVDEWKPKIHQLSRNADQLFALTNNLLYWSLIQQNGLVNRPTDLLLMDVLNDALTHLDGLIDEKHLFIRYKTPDANPFIRADEQQTAIILRNILHNAIKFSPVGGEISVAVKVWEERVHLLITDAGPGFEQTTHFDLFNNHGTGLGLQLVNDLMQANQGEFHHSNATDGGAVIQLIWPLIQVPQNATSPVSFSSN